MNYKKLTPMDSTESISSESHSEKVTFMVKKEVKQFLEIGKKFLDNGKIELAIKNYQKAVESDPSCALCHFNLAYAYHESNNKEYAKEHYEKAVELEPTCSLFIEHLARLYFETSDFRESIRLFNRAALIGRIQPLSLGLWGKALFEKGLYEESIETFEHLLEREHRPVIIAGSKYWLAVAHLKLKRTAAARRITNTLLKNNHVDYKILCDLGEHFIEAKCLSIARRIFEHVAILNEEVLLVRLRLEDIRSLEQQIDEMLPNLFDGDEERLLHLIHALKEFGNDRISKALLSFINSDSAPVRESVIRYQTTYGYDVTNSIFPLLKDEVGYVRDAAYEYFEKQDYNQFLNEIAHGLEDPLPSVRKRSIRYIGRFGTMEHLPILEMVLGCPLNIKFKNDIKQAINSIKKRYQIKNDLLFKSPAKNIPDLSSKRSKYEWRYWILILLHLTAVAYFIYYLISKL